jgi:peptidyl-prolyl cis-trans isomerase SurA
MVRRLAPLIVALALTGCGGRSYKVDHPVVGPAPPRIPQAQAVAMAEDEAAARGQSAEVQLVSTGGKNTQPFEMSDVVATVNGKPILVATVLGPSRAELEAIRKKATPAQFRQVQEHYLRQGLQSYVEQAMMVSLLEAKLDAERTKAINSQIDLLFDKQLDDMRAGMEKKLGRPCSMAELEAEIQSQGLTLSVMRKMFGDRAIAQQYMQTKLEGAAPISRPELLAAYQERIAEFTEPASVKWQQIQVSFRNFDDAAAARAHIDAALAELRRGTSFDAVAKKYSDGPDAASGGHWDWTQYDSLLTELKEPLSKLPPRTPSAIIATANALQIVQVVDRREARVKPFAEVQDQLREEIAEARHQAKVKEILDELRSQCVVTTIFDEPQDASPATPAAKPAVDKAFSTKIPDGG